MIGETVSHYNTVEKLGQGGKVVQTSCLPYGGANILFAIWWRKHPVCHLYFGVGPRLKTSHF